MNIKSEAVEGELAALGFSFGRNRQEPRSLTAESQDIEIKITEDEPHGSVTQLLVGVPNNTENGFLVRTLEAIWNAVGGSSLSGEEFARDATLAMAGDEGLMISCEHCHFTIETHSPPWVLRFTVG